MNITHVRYMLAALAVSFAALSVQSQTLPTQGGVGNDNNSNVLTNLSHLILGTNAVTVVDITTQMTIGNIAYVHDRGTEFANLTTDFRLSYRTALTYRAQTTVNGIPGSSHTVNMQVNSRRPQFVLVSAYVDFPPAHTRLYPIDNRMALNVKVNDGDHISFGGFEASPGGVTGFILEVV